MEGWIKMHRKILQWEWWDDHNTFRLFFFLLLEANHENKRWHGLEIQRGQIVTSYGNLAKATRLSIQSVRTSIKRLKSTREITHQPHSNFGLITIINYGQYQEVNTPANSQPTVSQQSSNNNIRIKELKNEKKYIYTETFEKFWKEYPRRIGKGTAYKVWIKLTDAEHTNILSVLSEHVQFYQGKEVQFIPHPSTWLNARQWEDEIPEVPENLSVSVERQNQIARENMKTFKSIMPV